jgi:uncharacterized protein (DUF1499 family)
MSRPHTHLLRLRIAQAALCVGLVSAAALAASGFGHRWGLWTYQTGFAMLRGVVYAGFVGAALALLGVALAVTRRRWTAVVVAVAALVINAVVIVVPWSFGRTAAAVPPIHDITTDTAAPPPFVALRDARAAAPNGVDYGGAAVAAQQARAYADIVSLRVAAPPERVFAAAEAAARQMGWRVAAAVPGEGRLEATATTPWFGFKDDVVVRVAGDGRGTKVDVRSASRVGRSDLGVNARRIRAFLDRLRSLQ